MVGNDFVEARPRLQLAVPAALAEPLAVLSITPVVVPHQEAISVAVRPAAAPRLAGWLDLLHRHSLVVFTLLFLLVTAGGLEVGSRYWSAHLTQAVPAATAQRPTITGLSLTVPVSQLPAKLKAITGQPASLTIGSQTVPIGSDTIKSWLRITADPSGTGHIYLNKTVMSKSLSDLAKQFVAAPVDQVTVNHGSGEQVILVGKAGTELSDPAGLTAQANAAAKTVLDAKGLRFSTPVTTEAAHSVTPAAFSKLIEVNLTAKQMWLYQNGQLIRNYAVSAGKPSTPTPAGEFHIFQKLPVQDMWGYNANGTKYFQPHVYWINYFKAGGYAIHGVYWHPLSWFGAINSSHGCVGIPDDEAQWVYNWAPIGTTVITYN